MKIDARAIATVLIVATAVLPATVPAQDVKPRFTIEQFIAPAFPYHLVAARHSGRIAWIENERGARNVYTAAAPDFRPLRLTRTPADDGVDLRPLAISDDGAVVVYIRGHSPGIGGRPDMPGWIANPAADPAGGRTEVWAAVTSGERPPWRVAAAHNAALSPDGRSVLFVQDGQIYCAAVHPSTAAVERCRPEAPLIRDFGVNRDPVWSPDGRKIAYVSERDDHSFVAVYDTVDLDITYLLPGVDYDSAPAWSPDSQRIAFLRRPGRPFAQWPEVEDADKADALPEGFAAAAFQSGHTQSIWIADGATGDGRELWQPADNFELRRESLRWLGSHLVFAAEPRGWRQLFALDVDEAGEERLLTPGEGEVEHVAASADGRWLYFTANVGDPERRQLWRVEVAGGAAEQITRDPGITTWPAVPGSGGHLAVLHAGARQPLSVALVPQHGGDARLIAPRLPEDFPQAHHVEPQPVALIADDGVRSHAQLLLPPDLRPGERRPALLFIHGGPRQQTLLGYHYQGPHGFYHLAYAMSQYFANRGYVTLSVNYRGGTGYGRDFREAAQVGAGGNAEYRDVVAAGRWLQQHADVDPARVGVWGLSYGGMLTTQALARHSDVFAAGVSIGGFALWEWSLDPDSISFRSSPVAALDSWRSPILLIHGDDDRNVDFSYTVALVQLLRARDIPFELIVFPNETHYFQVWQRWVETFEAMDEFFDRRLARPWPVQ